jgi:hypothetical protein
MVTPFGSQARRPANPLMPARSAEDASNRLSFAIGSRCNNGQKLREYPTQQGYSDTQL